MMNGKNFIKTQDEATAEELKACGFVLLDNANGWFTFVNDKTLKFSKDEKPVVYTDTLTF